jgi:hypothetical protein
MFTAARASGPETQKAGTPMPTSHNFVHNSEIEDSPSHRLTQYPLLVPRIIATHWLRAGEVGA